MRQEASVMNFSFSFFALSIFRWIISNRNCSVHVFVIEDIRSYSSAGKIGTVQLDRFSGKTVSKHSVCSSIEL